MENSVKGLPGLRTMRKSMKMSLTDLSNLSGYHPDFLRFLETGLRDCSQTTQRKLAGVLGCSVTDLLRSEDAPL